MTLIIGIEDPAHHRVVLACDSGAWKGDQADTLRTSKMWRSNGWIAGLAGSWGQSQFVRQVAMPTHLGSDPTIEDLDDAALRWSREVLDVCANHNELVRRADPDQKGTLPALLVAYGSRLWYLVEGEATTVDRGYQAIGTPVDYALGAMVALRRTDQGRDALEEASETMHAVHGISRSLLPPFRWMATDGTEGTYD